MEIGPNYKTKSMQQIQKLNLNHQQYIQIITQYSCVKPIYQVFKFPQQYQFQCCSEQKQSGILQQDFFRCKIMLLGSKLCLKYQYTQQCHIVKLKPFFTSPYVYLRNKEGYLGINSDFKMIVVPDATPNTIWICLRVRNKIQIINHKTDLNLAVDGSGSLFVTNRLTDLQISQLILNKLYRIQSIEQKKTTKIKTNKNDQNDGQKIKIIFQIIDDITIVTIYEDILYCKQVFTKKASLKFIKDIIHYLIYNRIGQFEQSKQILLNKNKQHLFNNEIIIEIQLYLKNIYQNNKIDIINKTTLIGSSFRSILKQINLLCLQNQSNTLLFLPWINSMINFISNQHQFIILLVQNNIIFFRKLHCLWLRVIVQSMLSINQYHINILKYLQLLSNLCYYHNCGVQGTYIANQYLIYHSFNLPALSHHNIKLNIYQQGLYLFIHTNKGITELKTYIEDDESKISQCQNMRIVFFITHLQLMIALCKGYNINIQSSYIELIISLLPYCYRNNFPTFKNEQIKSTILKLANCFYYNNNEPYLQNKERTGIILSTQKYKKQIHLEQINKISQNNNNFHNNYKMNEIPYKILKQISQYFLQKCMLWIQQIRKNNRNILKLLKQNYLLEWFTLLKNIFINRFIHIKHHKQTILLHYVKKIFQNVQLENHKQQAGQSHLVISLFSLLLQILKCNPEYDQLLSLTKIKRSYNESISTYKKIPTYKGNSVTASFKHYSPFSKLQSISKLLKHYPEKHNFLKPIKIIAVELYSVLILNTNEEYLEQSIQTLEYFLKNPSNFSNFSLCQSLPKYPMQGIFRKTLIQNWYLAGDRDLFDSLTTALRLQYCKVDIHIRNLRDIVIINELQEVQLAEQLSSLLKYLQKMVNSISTWFHEPLVNKYPDPYYSTKHCFFKIGLLIRQQKSKIKIQKIKDIIFSSKFFTLLIKLLKHLKIFTFEDNFAQQNFYKIYIESLLKDIAIIIEFCLKLGSNLQHYYHICSILFTTLKCQIIIFPSLLKCFSPLFQSYNQNLIIFLTHDLLLAFLKNIKDNYYFLKSWIEIENKSQYNLYCYNLYEVILKMTLKEIKLLQNQFIYLNVQCQHQYIFNWIIYKLIYINNANKHQLIIWYKKNILELMLINQIQSINLLSYKLEMTNIMIQNKSLIAAIILKLYDINNMKIQNQKNQKEEISLYILQELLIINNLQTNIQNNYEIQFLYYYIYDLLPLLSFIPQIKQNYQINESINYAIKLLKNKQNNYQNSKNMNSSIQYISIHNDKMSLKQKLLKMGWININVLNINNNNLQNSIQINQQIVAKEIKKWQKATNKFIKNNHDQGLSFLIDLCTFTQFYQFKMESDINLVINQFDLIRKLLQTSYHYNQVLINIENKLFIFLQIKFLLQENKKKNLFKHMNFLNYLQIGKNIINTMNIAINLIKKNANNVVQINQLGSMTLICIMLEIIHISQCFNMIQVSQKYIKNLLEWMQHFRKNFQACQNFLDVCQSSKQFIQQSLRHPLDIITQIMDQVNISQLLKVNKDYLKDIYIEILWVIAETRRTENQFKRCPSLFRIKNKIEKQLSNYTELNQHLEKTNAKYSYLTALLIIE